MKVRNFFINFILIAYMELLFGLLSFDTYSRSSIINIILFSLIISSLITIITSLFNKKILNYIIYSILGIFFSMQFVLKNVFGFFFSLDLFKLSDQVLKFGKETIISILKNFYAIILFFLPLILLIVFRKKYENDKKNMLFPLGVFLLSIGLFVGNIYMQKDKDNSIYYLYTSINDVNLNNEKLGIINSGLLDIYRNIFGFEEKIKPIIDISDKEELYDYDYNKIDIDFSNLKGNDEINNYLKNLEPTKKNKYTGMFERKNLIYIVAESFNTIGVREDLTPTLYKLINSGFIFNNYYSSNNLSTIGGEFQALTGLYADSSILATWRSGNNYFPYGLANTFKKYGYKTYAYHDHYYNFQDRNKYLKALGFDNYKGCYNGLESKIKCNIWPEFDTEMIKATTDDYLNSTDPFMVYYMTVSGHLAYNFYGNEVALKNYNKVKDLPYSTSAKAYLATQIELNDALELLINTLEEKGKLDDTVIVILPDHYPYGLNLNAVNELSSHQKDDVIGVNESSLIIWNSKMKNVEVDKTCMSIDVLPTVYNLFNIEYDSRLFAGNDILSTRNGLAIFNKRSWVSDKGKYYGVDSKYIGEEVDDAYIKNMNNLMNNKINISKLIVKNNYYKYLKDNGLFKNN